MANNKKVQLSLTKLEWYKVVEGLDETGKLQAYEGMRAKDRANGRALVRLASKLRSMLKGKL